MAISFGGRRFEPPLYRAINNEYHLELIAENTTHLKRELLNQRRTEERLAFLEFRNQDQAKNAQITQNLRDAVLGSLRDGFDRVADYLTDVDDTLHTINDSIQEGFHAVAGLLTQSVEHLWELVQIQRRSAEALNNPKATGVQELLREGQQWLKEGEKSEGHERSEHWDDALGLFEKATENEIGRQNYVAWFNIGYLRWNHHGQLAEAEAAFSRAKRLSAPTDNIWHTIDSRNIE
jgi:tetratricopeptide (TPR) repeat protein